MDRRETIRLLKEKCKMKTALDLLNLLQDRGQVSDNAVEMKDVATGDLETVLKKFNRP